MAIEAVVFDWGGVLAGSLDGNAEIEARIGVPPGSLRGLMGLEPCETDLTNPWHRRELGLGTALEWAEWYSDRVHAAGGTTVAPQVMVDLERTRYAIPANEVIIDAARRLKATGHQLAICTNNFAEIGDVWRAGLPMELFDTVVVSCELGVRKPDAAIFAHVTDRLGVTPGQTVLVDDLPANIDGARAVGWHAVLVGSDHAEAVAELDALVEREARR